MPANYTLIEKITVGAAGASSVTFSGIPQTGYTDLVIKASARCAGSATAFFITFNGSSANLSGIYLTGTGASAVSGPINPFGRTNYSGTTASTFSNNDIYIPNYTSSNFKSFSVDGVQEDNTTTAYSSLVAGLWSNTAAITSITLAPSSDTLVQYSTFYLYGVAKLGTTPAIVPYATGGDTIMTDGTYWYHAFLSSGTFTPQKSISCDYLVVAGGGGGGGKNTGGGGGAGGYRTSIGGTALSLGTSAYTVTIGAGGAGGTSPTQTKGSSGSNSVFSSITSSGGGGGGHGVPPNAPDARLDGITGGSGGGGGGTDTGGGGTGAAGNSGSYSPVEGYAGGNGANGANAGGGGGSSAVGANAVYVPAGANNGGNGGAGTSNSISGTSVTYAGGGGGGANNNAGTGGAGGGGNGGAGNPASQATAGSANTGGGGGGAGGYETTYSGGAGGSGIVIVRYAV